MELDHINRVALAVAEKHNLDIEDAVAKMYESSIYVIEISPTNGDIKILFGIEYFDDFCVESISSGWRGGVNFLNQKKIVFVENNSKISFGPIVSASLVCYHAFCKVFQINDDGIDLNFGISLWNLNSGDDWHKSENDGPEKPYLPRNIWTLGLGHLGQAYLWTLGLMPFDNPNLVQVLLQDADVVEPENIGSQVLCFEW
ncbi:MAG: hypothetical protein Q8R96_05435 [Bacteroidota bacterium]|nr:hypothetical protein [Bacteroidota bacterium]